MQNVGISIDFALNSLFFQGIERYNDVDLMTISDCVIMSKQDLSVETSMKNEVPMLPRETLIRVSGQSGELSSRLPLPGITSWMLGVSLWTFSESLWTFWERTLGGGARNSTKRYETVRRVAFTSISADLSYFTRFVWNPEITQNKKEQVFLNRKGVYGFYWSNRV